MTHKYRFKIINESTYEEVYSLKLSRLNLFVAFGILSLILIAVTTMVIAYTPLREYIPGYADVTIRKQALQLSKRTDSLEVAMLQKDVFLYNIKAIIDGKPTVRTSKEMQDSTLNYQNIRDQKSKEDSILRKELFEEKNYKVSSTISVEKILQFTPIRGQIVDSSNIPAGKFGVKIESNSEEPVKSMSDGIVLYTGWSPNSNYFIIILHPQSVISIYQNLSGVLPKAGDIVKAGEAIAQIKADKLGKRILYFETWNRNSPINPTHLITL